MYLLDILIFNPSQSETSLNIEYCTADHTKIFITIDIKKNYIIF